MKQSQDVLILPSKAQTGFYSTQLCVFKEQSGDTETVSEVTESALLWAGGWRHESGDGAPSSRPSSVLFSAFSQVAWHLTANIA